MQLYIFSWTFLVFFTKNNKNVLVKTIGDKLRLCRHTQISKLHCICNKTFQNKSLKHSRLSISMRLQEFPGGPELSKSFQEGDNPAVIFIQFPGCYLLCMFCVHIESMVSEESVLGMGLFSIDQVCFSLGGSFLNKAGVTQWGSICTDRGNFQKQAWGKGTSLSCCLLIWEATRFDIF